MELPPWLTSRRDTGERMSVTPPMMMSAGERGATGGQQRRTVRREHGDSEAAPHEEQVEEVDTGSVSRPSLAMAVKMKSVCGSGTTGWRLAKRYPRPKPRR
jgi:hypothetical protein